MVTVGQKASEWANDGLFGDGFHLFGVGTSKYEAKLEEFTDASQVVNAFVTQEKTPEIAAKLDSAAENFDAEAAKDALTAYAATVSKDAKATLKIVNLLEEKFRAPLRRNSVLSVSAIKRQFRILSRAASTMSSESFERINAYRTKVYCGDDYKEGITAFFEKRQPQYKGKAADLDDKG